MYYFMMNSKLMENPFSAEEPLVPSKIVAKMDVISAMEAVEDASGKYSTRKKTPPGSGSQVTRLKLTSHYFCDQ